MGYAMCLDSCGVCGRHFMFNPLKVPSLNDKAFCLGCVEEANTKRVAAGLTPHVIDPEAYEPCNEEEL